MYIGCPQKFISLHRLFLPYAMAEFSSLAIVMYLIHSNIDNIHLSFFLLQYIEEHRKPKLTFDEALKMVKQEMYEYR